MKEEEEETMTKNKQKELDSILDAALDELDDSDDEDQDEDFNEEDEEKIAITVNKEERKSSSTTTCSNILKKEPIVFGPEVPPPTRNHKSQSSASRTSTSTSSEEAAIKDMMRHMEALFPSEVQSNSTGGGKASKQNKSSTSSTDTKTTNATTKGGESFDNTTAPTSSKTKKTKNKSNGNSTSQQNQNMEETMSKLFEQLSQNMGCDGENNNNIGFDDFDAANFDGLGEEFMKNMAKEWESTMNGGSNGGEDQEEVVGQVVDGMMKQLLSKEFMYEPMKDICDEFPQWLAENKSKLDEKDYQKYGTQYQYFQRIVHIYENDPDNVDRLTELMHDIQEYGQPPPELVKKLAPELEFDQDGMPKMDSTGLGPMMNEECCIM